ncbi:hypothetical protein [Burkholderia sp. 22PA0106]|uniref:hypothetical protein n=1 Tax=Burkholderia sp. 22PA0106 TaxID=3237371 RepID=UPI0039C210A9
MKIGPAAGWWRRWLAFGAHDAPQRASAECIAGYADRPVVAVNAYADFIIVAVHWSQAGPPDRDGYLHSTIPFYPIEAT